MITNTSPRRSVVEQLYGYTVCLVALITLVTGLHGIVEHSVDLSNALHQTLIPTDDPNVAYGFFIPSFEGYRTDLIDRLNDTSNAHPRVHFTTIPTPATPAAAWYSDFSTESFKNEYREYVEFKVRQAKYPAKRALVGSIEAVFSALFIFGLYWRWLRAPGLIVARRK